MCGRYTLRDPERAVVIYLGRKRSKNPPPRFNIGPGREQLVVRASSGDPGNREAAWLTWGFVPSWSREERPKPIINARAETVASKPSFRDAFRRRRCLVPADGFYEWKRTGQMRQPFLFCLRDDHPFAFAGIWEEPRGETAAPANFCLLTTGPNALMESIHNRMPVILDEEGAGQWLEGEGEVRHLLRPFPAKRMTARPVSSFVNKIQNEGPECLAAPDDDDRGQLSLF